MTRLLLAAFASLALPAVTRADEIDDYVRAEMEKQQVPGLALAVVKDGKVLKAQGYGLANVEHQVPVKRETVFQSGSVGKQFTAMAVLLLVEDGKVKLDAPVGEYLPDVPEAWAGITVRHLLTHTSGVGTWDVDLRKDYTDDELLALAYKAKPKAKPGEKWEYSNTGYAVLGILVNKVAGRFYGDFLADRVFTPLGMKTARIISEADIIPNRAAGYRTDNGLKNQQWVSPTMNRTADGSLYVTLDDLIRWDAALAAGKLISKESYAAMWSPVKLADGKEHPYGFGWSLGAANGHRRVHHGGAWQGFTAYIDRYPDDGLTVIVLANMAAPRSRPAQVAAGVAGLVVPELKDKK